MSRTAMFSIAFLAVLFGLIALAIDEQVRKQSQPVQPTEYDAERMQVVLDAILKLREIDQRHATNRLEKP